MAAETKSCTKCGRVLPLNDFPPHRGKHDGLQSYCRACQMRRVRAQGAANRAERYAVHVLKRRHRPEYEEILAGARARNRSEGGERA